MSTADCQRFDSEGVPRLAAGEPPDEHEVGCPTCRRERARYQRIIDAFAELPAEKAPSGWQERVLESLPADAGQPAVTRSWPLWAALAVAAAVLLWRVAKPEPSAARLAVKQEVVSAATGRRADPERGPPGKRDSATIGDAVRVVVTGGPGDVREARLYRDTGELVARCPGHESCRSTGVDLELTVTLTAAGSYRTLAIAGSRPAPEPSGSLDEDARAAAAAGASVELSRAIDVE